MRTLSVFFAPKYIQNIEFSIISPMETLNNEIKRYGLLGSWLPVGPWVIGPQRVQFIRPDYSI